MKNSKHNDNFSGSKPQWIITFSPASAPLERQTVNLLTPYPDGTLENEHDKWLSKNDLEEELSTQKHYLDLIEDLYQSIEESCQKSMETSEEIKERSEEVNAALNKIGDIVRNFSEIIDSFTEMPEDDDERDDEN